MLKILIAFIIGFSIYEYLFYVPVSTPSSNNTYIYEPSVKTKNIKEGSPQRDQTIVSREKSDLLQNAYRHGLSNIQVKAFGRVIKILKDDNKGSRHQRFILSFPSGQTVLIAHNIDLAPKIDNLKIGDTIYFFGEYIWNKKGGVIHWTHHDPGGRHVAGWLKHQGHIYQ